MRPLILAALVPLAAFSSGVSAQGAPVPPATPATPATPPAAAAPTVAAPAPITAASVDREAVIALGRHVATWANVQAIDSLVGIADPGVGTPESVREKLTSGLASFADQLGAETKVIAERVMIVNGAVQYWRTAEFSAVPVPLVFRVIVGRDGKWRGFTVNPESELPPGEEVKP